MNNICIRKAKESDLPAIEKLIVELIESMKTKEDFDPTIAIKNCRNFLHNSSSYLLVAERDRAVIGFINITIRLTLLHPGGSGLIDELIVGKAYRKKGIGKLLIDATIEKCKQLGCCEVEVSTEFTNTTARRFYKNSGFEERGVTLEKDL